MFATLLVVLAAALFFSSEPATGKTILPWLGGTPAAWGTTLVFFQSALIVGYGLVDLSLRRGGARGLAVTHCVLLVAAAIAVLFATPFGTTQPPAEATFFGTFGLLSLELGLPIVALSLTSPALQARRAALRGDQGAAGYSLYAASNTGSLLGLLAYPWLVEPLLPLTTQWRLWSGAFAVLAIVIGAHWFSAWSRLPGAAPAERSSTEITWPRRLQWIARAAVPAALLAAVTSYLTRDLAPIPLLWVIPLALYLGTWIVAFGGRMTGFLSLCSRLQDVVAVAAAMMFLLQPGVLVGAMIALVAMIVVGLVQHTALARSAPSEAWLGRYYVWLAIGGTIGTFFVVVVAPILSPVPIEAPLALALAVAMGQPSAPRSSKTGQLVFLAFGAVAVAVAWWATDGELRAITSLCVAAGVLIMAWRTEPLRSGMVIAGLAIAGFVLETRSAAHLGSAHGLLGRFVVRSDGTSVELVSGSTLHGAELLADSMGRPRPTLYFVRHGPYGDLIRLVEQRGPGRRLGIAGLGIGSLSCTSSSESHLTYFEIDPGVVRLARDTSLFRTLHRCSPTATIRLGDARISLESISGSFDLLALDAFNSDAIPTHLLTREAVRLYRARVRPGGIIAFHVSNRFLDLTPVVAGLAHDAGWASIRSVHELPATASTDERPVMASMVAMAADRATLQPLVEAGQWTWTDSTGPVWTDNWTPVARALTISRASLVGK